MKVSSDSLPVEMKHGLRTKFDLVLFIWFCILCHYAATDLIIQMQLAESVPTRWLFIHAVKRIHLKKILKNRTYKWNPKIHEDWLDLMLHVQWNLFAVVRRFKG